MADITLTTLAQRGELGALEDRWLTAIDMADEYRQDMLETLAILNKNGKGDEATDLAWTWLSAEAERSAPEEVLALGRELILRCSDSDEMRAEITRLYGEVFLDRPGINKLLEYSGLGGSKSPRRALRTLEICLNLKAGDCLLARSEEKAAKVLEADPENCQYVIVTRGIEQTLDPDELALAYDPVDANDFRVLKQLYPDKIPEMLEADPVTLVIGILKSHHGQLDADELKHLLTPRLMAENRWGPWWNKARAALKRCRNVVLEGRNPVILFYHAEGRSLEDEVLPQWGQAETPAQRLSAMDTYLREAKARRTDVKKQMIERMYKDLCKRIETSRDNSPADALAEALIIDRLAEEAEISDGNTAREILTENNDPVELLRGIKESARYIRALELTREVCPDDWPEIYSRLLPFAPINGCKMIAGSLLDNADKDQLTAAMSRITDDFREHLDAICWLWRGPSIGGLDSLERLGIMSPKEMLPKILEHLAELTRNETTPLEVLRDARAKIRAALSANKYARFRQVITEMGDSMAFTVHRTIDRIDGLGQVVRAEAMGIIQGTYPHLFMQKRIDPWLDDEIIFCTREGLNRYQEDLNHLLNVKIPQNAKAIGEAASHGDLSENSEYKFALEERDLLHARVAIMQTDLGRAHMLNSNDIFTESVEIGTRVTIASPLRTPEEQSRQMRGRLFPGQLPDLVIESFCAGIGFGFEPLSALQVVHKADIGIRGKKPGGVLGITIAGPEEQFGGRSCFCLDIRKPAGNCFNNEIHAAWRILAGCRHQAGQIGIGRKQFGHGFAHITAGQGRICGEFVQSLRSGPLGG